MREQEPAIAGALSFPNLKDGVSRAKLMMIKRLKYLLIVWFFDKPNALNRRVEVENILLIHARNGTSISAEECQILAMKLGIPK